MLILTGCGAMPASGPTVRDITDNAVPENNYTVVPITPAILAQLDAVPTPSLAAAFGNAEPAPVKTIQPGDVLAVTIWDAGGGLFSQAGSAQAGTQTTPLPNQVVDSHGNITVPFAGQVHVAGRSTVAAQKLIMNGLANQTIRPQVIVSVVSDQGNLITVVGEVKKPGRQPLALNGTRALDAIASAEGTAAPVYEDVLQLTRKGKTSRVRLSWVLAHPADNIFLQPDDTLYIVRDPASVSVLGAVKDNSKVEFGAEQLSLAESLGRAGGLVDMQSEPAGIFVFRMEPASVIAAIKGTPSNPSDGDPLTPVIFRADLRHAQDFFLVQSFKMQNKDLVYVANAESAQIDKVLKIMLHAAGIAGLLTNKNGLALGE